MAFPVNFFPFQLLAGQAALSLAFVLAHALEWHEYSGHAAEAMEIALLVSLAVSLLVLYTHEIVPTTIVDGAALAFLFCNWDSAYRFIVIGALLVVHTGLRMYAARVMDEQHKINIFFRVFGPLLNASYLLIFGIIFLYRRADSLVSFEPLWYWWFFIAGALASKLALHLFVLPSVHPEWFRYMPYYARLSTQ